MDKDTNTGMLRPLDKVLVRLLYLHLFLPLLSLSLLAIGLAAYLGGRDTEARQQQLVSHLAQQVDDYLDHSWRMLGAVALTMETSTPEESARYMEAAQKSYGYFDTLYRLDKKGMVTALTPADPRYQGLDMSRQLYFQQLDPNSVYVSQPFNSPRTDQLTVYVAHSLTGGGLVVGELNLTELQKAATTGRDITTGTELFIVDRSGDLLAHRRPELVAQHVNLGNLEILKNRPVGGTGKFYFSNGSLVVGSAAPVERTGWVVVGQVPILVAYGPYFRAGGLAVLLSPAIWLSVMWLIRRQFRRQISSPLDRLSRWTHALAAGDFAQSDALASIPTTFAELSALVADFHHMSQAIQARQAELRESEERLRLVIQNMPVMMDAFDENWNIIAWNRESEQVTGFSADEIVGSPRAMEMLYPDGDYRRSMMDEWIRRGNYYRNWEWETTCKDGSVKTISWSNISERFPIQGWASWGTGVDVTERRRAEEALRDSRERYRTLVAQAPIGIVTCNRRGDIVDLNRSLLAILGSPDEESLRQYNLLNMPPVPGADLSEDFRRCLKEDTLVISERSYRSFWDKEVTIRLRLVPLRDKRGDLDGVLATVEDISEQRKLEMQLRQAQKLEAVGTLAGGIAHEFNNLLTGIIGSLSLVMPELGKESQSYHDLQNVERSARRAAELTRQLLTLSRKPIAGKLEPLILNPVVEEVVSLLRRTIDRRIEVNLRLAANLWLVEANPSQMNQVIMNLCLNSRDAIVEYLQGKCTGPGRRPDEQPSITIETSNVTLGEDYCRLHPEASPGRFVRLAVQDNGCGMDARTQERLFEPFFTTKEVGQGTGLGLATIFGIVKGHNGFINYYSEPGIGTVFRVYLPCSTEERKAKGAKSTAAPADATPVGTETILLVDDDEGVRGAGRRILENWGYTVLMAADGREALELFKKEGKDVDLVLLDLTMPKMSGLETLRGILQVDPQARIILVSGYSAERTAEAALAEGAAAFVQKPFDLLELARTVRAVLDGSRN